MINIKRAYEKPTRDDGQRIFVERLWPRGLSKNHARFDLWLKDLAPSTELRQWFGHDPARWPEFKKRYWAELRQKKDAVHLLKEKSKHGSVTLVYGAKDQEHNSALALKEFLKRPLGRADQDARKPRRTRRAS